MRHAQRVRLLRDHRRQVQQHRRSRKLSASSSNRTPQLNLRSMQPMSITQFKNLALGLGLSTLLGTFAFAQGAAAPAPGAAAATGAVPTKIGVVNIQQAIQESAEGKKEIDALQTRFPPKQVELKGLNDDVENLKKQYQAQAENLSHEAKCRQPKSTPTKHNTLHLYYQV